MEPSFVFKIHVEAADNCEFESGAPLIQGVPPVVVGIKSVSQECAKSSHVVYTRISYYFNWLISVAGYQPLLPTSRLNSRHLFL